MQTVQEDIRQLGVDSLWHALTQHKPLKDKPQCVHIVRGEGCYIYDSEGNSYLDALAVYGVSMWAMGAKS
ncbi:MAG: hypothetical protein R2865_00410 [Deinococcales bacterium]